MARNCWLVAVLCFCMATLGWAEPTRTLLTTENKYPETRQLEVGVSFDYDEDTVFNGLSVGPYARYGLMEKLTGSVRVPYLFLWSDYTSDEQGLGDVELGLDLSPYDDEYGDLLFIIPYIRLTLPTGNEDDGLGAGEMVFTFGTSVGSTVLDIYTFILDGAYTFQPDEENATDISAAFIWDATERFAMMLEARMTDERSEGDYAYMVTGAMSYKVNENLSVRWGGGPVENSPQDVVASFKASYTF
ncbi:MAG: hypothetical protein JXR37_07850 [Kiritimatiellae bacterium]|nr:hypothetical protein [Kiritimatiellia bacterium]